MTTLKVLEKSYPTEPSDPILKIEELFLYVNNMGKRVRILNNINLEIPKGKVLGLVGESGSGKTMLAKTIIGLNSHFELTGKIIFNGTDLLQLKRKEMRNIQGSEISMVFQDPLTALNPVIKVGKQITEAILAHIDVTEKEAKAQALELLRSMAIPDPDIRFNWYPHQFSGGQRQRILIAIALSCGPKLLLADEPTTGLDATLQRQTLELIAKEQIQRNMSVLIISHDLSVISDFCDWVAVMYAGKIVEYSSRKEIFTNPKMPYTKALLDAMPQFSKTSKLKTIRGNPPELQQLPQGCPFSPRCDLAQVSCFEQDPDSFSSADNTEHRYSCFFPVNSLEAQAAEIINNVKLALGYDFSVPLKTLEISQNLEELPDTLEKQAMVNENELEESSKYDG